MKKCIRILTYILFALAFVSCMTMKPLSKPKVYVRHLGDTIGITEGSLVYALPMTLLEITAEFERTIEKPGPYARYALDMLGLKNVITSETESWAITGLKIRSYEEIDPSEFYIIESSTLINLNAIELRKAGLILDISPSAFNEEKSIMTGENGDLRQLEFTDLGADEYYVSQNDTAFRLVKLDTTFIQIPYLVERKRVLPLDQLAERAARTLLELREGKHYILTGEANVFPQSPAALNEMNRLENEYTALFAGKTLKDRQIVRYTFIPQKESAGTPVVLFRFSDTTGPSDASSKTGDPVTIELIPARKTKDITFVIKPQLPEEEAEAYDKLFYRIPDVVSVSVKRDKVQLYNTRKLVYQLGEVVQLPANYILGK